MRLRGLADFAKIDVQIVRGLAYYTGTVFEIFDRAGKFRAIAGGGRYDHLVKLISGGKVDLPALGFGLGDVVLIELLKARGKLPAFNAGVDVYCLIPDETARPAALRLVQDLRDAGRTVEYSLTSAKVDKQLKRAVDMSARWTVQSDGDSEVVLRNLATRDEVRVPRGEILARL